MEVFILYKQETKFKYIFFFKFVFEEIAQWVDFINRDHCMSDVISLTDSYNIRVFSRTRIWCTPVRTVPIVILRWVVYAGEDSRREIQGNLVFRP